MSGVRNSEFRTSYQPLNYDANQEEDEDNLHLEDPTDVLIHVVPPVSKKKWNHIQDLDSFFRNLYQYHQSGGYFCICLENILGLLVFLFMDFLMIVFGVFVNYDELFNKENRRKVYLSDIFYSFSEVIYPWYIVIAIFFSALFIAVRVFYIFTKLQQYKDIRNFYSTILGIDDCELENIPWNDVQQRILEVQAEHRMCIHKESLTELDIYHRILRFKNYFIAMVNKDVIQLKLNVPVIGDVTYLSAGLKFNIKKILFTGPWAPFHNNWQLGDHYKQLENRHRLAAKLEKQFLICSLVNFILIPVVMVWNVFMVLYDNTGIIAKDPGVLGLRRWSDIAQVNLRHFNELDHEFRARLSRAYRPAVHYMDIFFSPLASIAAKHFSFIFAVIFAIFTFLALYDEDVIFVQHWLLLGSVAFGCYKVIQSLMVDVNMVMCPEILMTRILAETNYLPDSWKGKAHTKQVCDSFSVLFEYRACKFFKELISPIMTPFMLYFVLRPKSLEIVDFLRNFTVDVVGVGDICSFSQMDIKKHGSVTWQPYESDYVRPANIHEQNLHMSMNCGKTELSLLHFTFTNPMWKPPHESSAFLAAMMTQAQKDYNDLNTVPEENALINSINSMSLGAIGDSVLRLPWLTAYHAIPGCMSKKIKHLEGSRHGFSSGVLGSVSQSLSNSGGLIADPIFTSRHEFVQARPLEMTAVDMGVSALYLHEYHNRKLARENS